MEVWKSWKQGFDAWEQATATLMEQVVQSPAVLGPAGAMMSAAMRAKADANRRAANMWGQAGVAVKRDQERMMHAVNQLGSRLLDMQEQMAAQNEEVMRLRALVEALPATLGETLPTAVVKAMPAPIAAAPVEVKAKARPRKKASQGTKAPRRTKKTEKK